MKKTKNMIDKVTTLRWMPLLMALFFASCKSDDLTIPTDMPQGMKTVTVDFQLPDDKPAFHEEGQSRAATGWTAGDELLMNVNVSAVGNQAFAFLTLKNDGTAWDVVTGKSYVRIVLNEVANNYSYDKYPLLTATENLTLTEGLTLMLDEAFGEATTYTVTAIYAPDMERNGVDDDGKDLFKLKVNATTTAPESWSATATTGEDASLALEWRANQARLRVNTGAAGDVVTLTSSEFTPKSVTKSADDIYTATTQADGYAYFYGTMDEQTENFKLELTAIGGTDLDTPVTLLEASALVPVKLEAGKAYWLDASAKRNNVSQ